MKNLYLFPIGKDRFDRPVYRALSGNVVVDIDPRDPRKDLRTKWPAQDAYYGEPDCHLNPELKPVFVDELVEEANQRLESAGESRRLALRDGRTFVNNGTEAGDDFTEISWEKAIHLLERVINDKQ